MITFLTAVKDFVTPYDALQRRAFANWKAICPSCERVVFGTGIGVDEACEALQIKQVTDIECSSSNIPHFESLAQWAKKYARHDIQIYTNADILFPPDLCTYIEKIHMERFLLVGQRIDLLSETHFDDQNFYASLAHVLQKKQAQLHRPSGMDFFIFKRGIWQNLKPLIVGRGGYDSALVTYCLRKAIPVIDVSFAFPVIHQWHDYTYANGGRRAIHNGAEAQQNFNLHQLRHFAPNCMDADFMMLRSGEIRPNVRKSWLRNWELNGYYKRGYTWCPRWNQVWNLKTRGGKYIKAPDWGKEDFPLMSSPEQKENV